MKLRVPSVRTAVVVAVAASIVSIGAARPAFADDPAASASSASVADASASSTGVVLTQAQIYARFQQIEATYTTVGQMLSQSDSDFVKKYGNYGALTPNDSTLATPDDTSGTKSFKKTGSGAGATGTQYGSFSLTIGTLVDNDYGMKIYANGSSKVTKIKNCSHIHAYGVGGSGGLGLSYYNDDCNTVSGTGNSYSISKHFAGFIAYTVLDADSTFYTKTGSFELSSSASTTS